jgi:hypothetical protein
MEIFLIRNLIVMKNVFNYMLIIPIYRKPKQQNVSAITIK